MSSRLKLCQCIKTDPKSEDFANPLPMWLSQFLSVKRLMGVNWKWLSLKNAFGNLCSYLYGILLMASSSGLLKWFSIDIHAEQMFNRSFIRSLGNWMANLSLVFKVHKIEPSHTSSSSWGVTELDFNFTKINKNKLYAPNMKCQLKSIATYLFLECELDPVN